MGRTRESKDVTRRQQSELDRLNTDYGAHRTSREGFAGAARGRSDEIFNEARENYRKFLSAPSGFGGGGGGGSRGGPGYYEPSAENIGRMRGAGVFDEFAKTGGLSEDDKSVYRARGTATVPAFYEAMRNQLQRSRNMPGAITAGYDSSMRALGREQAQGAQAAATAAEADILDRVSAGRQWGAGSMSDAERAVVDATQRGRMYEGEMGYRNRGLNLDAIRGLQSLRTDTPGEVNMYEQDILQGMGQGDVSRGSMMDQYAQYHPNQNWFQRNKELLGFGVGAAGMFVPGMQAGGAKGLLSRLRRGRVPGGPTANIGGNAGG